MSTAVDRSPLFGMRLTRRRWLLGVTATASAMLAACQSAPAAAPTTAPKPAEATKPAVPPAASPAAPAASPAAASNPAAAASNPAAAAAASPVASPAASPAAAAPAAAPASAPAAASKPSGPLAAFKLAVSGEGELTNGQQKATNFNKVPNGIAIESLIKDGVKVEASYLNESEAPMQALIQGSVQFAHTAFSSAISAIAKGAPVKIIATTRRPEYVMVALKEMKTAKDYDGKRVAIHSNVSSVALMTRLYLKDAPAAKPNIIVVPGSPNRIQAMVGGQIDASVVQLGDDDAILKAQPDKWAVTFNYAKEMTDLLDAVLVVRDDFLAANRPTVVEFVKRLVAAHKQVNTNSAFLIETAKRMEVVIPKSATLENHAQRYVDAGVWPNDGGLTEKNLQFSIAASKELGFFTEDVPLAKASDLTVLKDALA